MLTENICFNSRLLRIGGLGLCVRCVVFLYLALFFLTESSYEGRPPPHEAGVTMSGNVNVQSCFTFLAILLLKNLANSAKAN